MVLGVTNKELVYSGEASVNVKTASEGSSGRGWSPSWQFRIKRVVTFSDSRHASCILV